MKIIFAVVLSLFSAIAAATTKKEVNIYFDGKSANCNINRLYVEF